VDELKSAAKPGNVGRNAFLIGNTVSLLFELRW
jgi:hypothetical protein